MDTKIIIFGIIFFLIIASIIAYFMFNKKSATPSSTSGSSTSASAPSSSSATQFLDDVEDVDCKLIDDVNMFCASPDAFAASCMAMNDSQGKGPSRIATKLLNCRNNHLGLLKEQNYNRARDAVLRLIPEFGDPANNNYIGKFPTVDCNKIDDINVFCPNPDKFAESCMATNDSLGKGPSRIATRLLNCRNTRLDLLKEPTYNKARDAVLRLIPEFGDPANNNYIGKFPTVDCNKIDDVNVFCPDPDKFAESCMATHDSLGKGPSRIATKLLNCRNNHLGLLKEPTYNKARAAVLKLIPDFGKPSDNNYIGEFPSIDCNKIDDWNTFCQGPDKFANSCMATNDSGGKGPSRIATKLIECRNNYFSITNKEGYNKARDEVLKFIPQFGDPNNNNYIRPFKIVQPTSFIKFSDYKNYIRTMKIEI